MPKTANDPFFGTSAEPNFGGRRAFIATPSDTTDFPNVVKQLLVNIGATGTGIAIILADDPDYSPITITLPVGFYQFAFQVRRLMATGTALGTGGQVTAIWG
jgi:hypothetical protein